MSKRPDIFPLCRVKKSCNTQSIPAIFCLARQKNLSLLGILLFFKQALVRLYHAAPSFPGKVFPGGREGKGAPCFSAQGYMRQ